MTPAAARRVVNAAAPIRICDNGGWTDTWFSGHGRIFNIAVSPCVEVQVEVFDRAPRQHQVVLHAENYGDRYALGEGDAGVSRHPLLEATVEEMGVPEHVAIEISIHSTAPAGCSTGTSAAATVALIGALDALTPGRMTPHEVATTAHRIEVQRLGLQSGIQDQLSAAYGGINYIEMDAYPYATVHPIHLSDPLQWELQSRLALVFLGSSHVSSDVHEQVIAGFDAGGGQRHLDALRRTAGLSRDALHAGDLAALGQAMVTNTAAQQELHPGLVSDGAQTVIDVARAHGALGWKVNGAGGEGGSVTVLCGPSAPARRAMVATLESADPLFRLIPTSLSPAGLRVWDSG